MTNTIILLAMIYMHIIDDFYLQGILAKMKQQSWWKKQEGYNDFYGSDYIVALIIHGISWGISINIPLMAAHLLGYLTINEGAFMIILVMNVILHIMIDDMKANLKWINLQIDQILHFLQVIATYVIIMYS